MHDGAGATEQVAGAVELGLREILTALERLDVVAKHKIYRALRRDPVLTAFRERQKRTIT